MADYITVTELQNYINQTDPSAAQTTFLGTVVTHASRYVDHFTGTWFDNRTTQTIKTQAAFVDQKRLFMPAKIISITSITETGVLIAATDYVIYKHWIEKKFLSTWSNLQLDIVVIGAFGYAAVPSDIKAACLEVGAAMSQMRKKSWVDEAGNAGVSIVNSISPWARETLQGYKLNNQVGQVFA